jgi:hypothetical protein
MASAVCNSGAHLAKAAQAGDCAELVRLLRSGVDPDAAVLAKLPADRPLERSVTANGAVWQWTTMTTSALFAAADHNQVGPN